MCSYHHRLDDWLCFMAMVILENSVYDAGLHTGMRSCTNAFHDWHAFKRADWSVFVMQPCIRKCWLLENFEKHLPDNGLSFILCFHTSSYATASVLSLGHYGFRGGASLQIENAQLKLHFSSCMLVLSFEWMNILQPTLCVNLFHAFESSIIFEKTSFYGLSSRPCAVDRFPKGHCFGWLSSNSSYHRKWRRTRLKLYSQSEERTLFRAVYELFWCGLWKQHNGGKYGCCNFFLKYFVKIGRLGKKFTHRLILCSFIYKSMYYTSGFVEKYDGNGLKTMTMWQKKNLKLGLRIAWVRRTPDQARWRRLKNTKQLSSKCSKSTKTKAKHIDLRNIRLICLFRQVFG